MDSIHNENWPLKPPAAKWGTHESWNILGFLSFRTKLLSYDLMVSLSLPWPRSKGNLSQLLLTSAGSGTSLLPLQHEAIFNESRQPYQNPLWSLKMECTVALELKVSSWCLAMISGWKERWKPFSCIKLLLLELLFFLFLVAKIAAVLFAFIGLIFWDLEIPPSAEEGNLHSHTQTHVSCVLIAVYISAEILYLHFLQVTDFLFKIKFLFFL